MAFSIILHISGEEAVQGEVDDLPTTSDTMIKVSNPHKLDGKDVHYLTETVSIVFWPVHRINFIEILPSKEQEAIIGFVRE